MGSMTGQFCVERRIDTIPALDVTRMRLFEVFEDEDANVDGVERVIGTDPAVTAKVIKLANSPFYRHSQQHLSLRQSLMTIGLDMVKCITLSMEVMNALRSETQYARSLWAHSYSVALTALPLGANKPEKDRLFTGSLLHDLGRMIFLHLTPEMYTALFGPNGERPGEELEQQAFSIGHTALGEMVGRRWNFPEEIVEIIRGHHRPVSRDSALVYLVNSVVCRCERGAPESDPLDDGAVRPFLGDAYKDLVSSIAQRYKTSAAMIKGLF
jgi:putative nucleotidyltransferase with HDIG domain